MRMPELVWFGMSKSQVKGLNYLNCISSIIVPFL